VGRCEVSEREGGDESGRAEESRELNHSFKELGLGEGTANELVAWELGRLLKANWEMSRVDEERIVAFNSFLCVSPDA
jgi:hypothetical protein